MRLVAGVAIGLVGVSSIFGCASGGESNPVVFPGADAATDVVEDAGVDRGTCGAGLCCATSTDCIDSTGCTYDMCDVVTGVCSNTPMDDACPEGTFCQINEGCVTAPGCEFDSDCGGDGVFWRHRRNRPCWSRARWSRRCFGQHIFDVSYGGQPRRCIKS